MWYPTYTKDTWVSERDIGFIHFYCRQSHLALTNIYAFVIKSRLRVELWQLFANSTLLAWLVNGHHSAAVEVEVAGDAGAQKIIIHDDDDDDAVYAFCLSNFNEMVRPRLQWCDGGSISPWTMSLCSAGLDFTIILLYIIYIYLFVIP